MSRHGVIKRAFALVLLLWGSTNSPVLAEEKAFTLGGTNVTLQEVSATTEVYFQTMRLNRALNQWNFELKVRNTATRTLTGPVVVVFEAVTNATGPLSPDGVDDTGKPWVDMSAKISASGLLAGQESQPRTLALGVKSGSPGLTARVFGPIAAGGLALALANVVDEVGHPVASVQISETGPEGAGLVDADPILGTATLGRGQGTNLFQFSAPGYLPVWRQSTLANGTVIILPTPRLPLRETNASQFTSAAGVLSNRLGSVRVTVPAGAFDGSGQARLTSLTPQTLPAQLPLGWSPLQAFWLELSREPVSPLLARLYLLDAIKPGESAALARWDAATLDWKVAQLVPGLGASVIDVSLTGSGAWTLVVPDAGITAPPAPVVSQALRRSLAAVPNYTGMVGRGEVSPASSPASVVPALVTAQAHLVVSNASGALPSGTLFRGEMTEHYDLQDRTARVIPPYQVFLVGYQRPGDLEVKTLEAIFPMRPQLLLGADELQLGSVTLDVLSPTDFAGGVLNTNGLSVTNGVIRISIGPGAINRAQAVQLDQLDGANYAGLLPDGFSLAAAFQFAAGGLSNQPVSLQVGGLSTNCLFVLARVRFENGIYGFEPVQRFITDGEGLLASLEPSSLPRLSGISGSGQFVLVKVPSAQSLLAGIARNAAGQPVAGLLVRRQPWLTFSGEGGAFQLLSSAGEAQLLVTDLSAGDIGALPMTVPAGAPLTGLDIAAISEGPRVLSVLPTDGSTNVPLVSAVEMVFSRPLNPASVLGAIRLASTSTSSVPASVTLNLRGNVVTLLPDNPLAAGTRHTLALSTNLADLSGQKLVGSNTFSFVTTQPDFVRNPGSQLVSYEPTNGFVRMEGTQGLVEPGKPVVLVNETTGRTSTTLADPDGGFRGDLQAEVDDKLSITLVNANGTRNSIPVSKQLYADGSVALFESGGFIDTPSENGPIRFNIEPGAIHGKTTFKFESVPLTNVLTLVSNVAIENGGRILGGVKVSAIVGAQLSQSMDVSFPVRVSDMQLPNGVSPSNCSFGLVISRVVDGEQVFEQVDRMQFEDGKLVTHSPPFHGLLGPFEDILLMPLMMAVAETMLTVNGSVYAVEVSPATGQPLLGATKELLPGALVAAKPASTSIESRGRLRPGAVYTVVGGNGKYTLMVTIRAGSSESAVGVTATHPKFPGVRGESKLPDLDPATRLSIGNVLTPQDVFFSLRAIALRAPPVMAVTQSPADPPPASNTVVTVLVTDNDSRPTLSYFVNSAVALDGSSYGTPDITVSDQTDQDVGTLGKRYTFTVSSRKASIVDIQLRATDGTGNVRSQVHRMGFGVIAPQTTNAIPVADANDKTGPAVVTTEPSADASGHAVGQPVQVQFDEAIDSSVVADPVAVSIVPAAGTPHLSLSDDQTRMFIEFPLMRPDTEYAVTLGASIKDISGNHLAGPERTNSQSFVFTFRTAPLSLGLFPAVGEEIGVGVQILGNRAFLMKRVGTKRGKLEAYDLSTPLSPRKIGEVSIPEYPRDMLLIPAYSYWWRNPALGGPVTNVAQISTVVTNDLLVAVGGLAGAGTFQWMRVYDLKNPDQWSVVSPFVAGGILAIDGLALPSALRWSAPALSYLETGSPDRISVLDLQSWLIGTLVADTQSGFNSLPLHGRPGTDLNGDGDYADPGELPTLPARLPFEFLGKELAIGAFETTQPIFDQVLEKGGLYLGVVLGKGQVIGTNGLPPLDPAVDRVAASFRSLYSAGLGLDRTNASFDYPEGFFPRRAAGLFDFPLLISNRLERLDLVAVTVRGPGSNLVSVLDVTDRLAPREMDRIPIAWEGNNTNIYGIRLRADGLLAVATQTNVILINPSRFGQSWTNGSHPALYAVLPGIGGASRTFDSTPGGLGVSPDVGDYGSPARGMPVISMGPPKLEVVLLPGVTPFDPSTLAALPLSNVNARLEAAFPAKFIPAARFRGETGMIASSVTNKSSLVHHYALVHAPGGAGQFLDLAVEAVNESGEALTKRGFLFPPVHGFAPSTLLALGQVPGPDDAPVRPLRAWRASNDPASPNYNLYVSRPFLLVNEELSVADLAGIRLVLDRDVFWGGDGLRFSFDPGAVTNSVTGPFVGRVHSGDLRYRPGVALTIPTFPGGPIQSPNPGPLVGRSTLPLVANALNTHNGELTINATDMALPGRRLPIEFRRNYSGQGLSDGPFGRGWDFNFNQRVVAVRPGVLPVGEMIPLAVRDSVTNSEFAAENDLLFYNGGGRITAYKFAGTNPPASLAADPLVQQLNWLPKIASFYLPPDGLFAPMFRFKDGRYVRLDSDGKQTWYTPSGRLSRMYDRYEKNFIDLVYNRRGQLVRIYDDVGRPLDIGYYRVGSDTEFRAGIDETLPAAGASTRFAALGRIARLKDYSGRDVLFFYTADGLLERRLGVDVQTAAPGGFTGREETRYYYSDSSDPVRTAGSLIAVRGSEPGGAAVAAVESFSNRGRDNVGALLIGGARTKVEQSHFNTARAMSAGNGSVKFTSPDASLAEMRFDSFGRVTQSTLSGPTGVSETNRTIYYPNGLVAAIIRPMGGRTDFYYDTNNPSLRSRGNLVRVRKTPDSRGGPVLEASSHFDPVYNLQEGENFDYRGTLSIITLNPDKRDVFHISRAGEIESFSVNEFGQMERHTTIDNVVSETLFNADGFPQYSRRGSDQSILSYGPAGTAASDSGRRGRPSSVTDPETISTSFLHDEADRLVTEERAGARASYAFDAPGNLSIKTVQIETNRFVVERFYHSAMGFMTSNVLENVETGGSVSNLVTVYEADEFSRLKKMKLPSGEEQAFHYDHAGRLVKHVRIGAQTNTFEYDANGNLDVARVGASEERYLYDGHDRMVGVLMANGSRQELILDGNGSVTTNSTYDSSGTLLERSIRELDELNRVRRVTRLRDTGASTVRTDFNSAAREVTTTDALNAQATTTFDDAGRPWLVQTPNFKQRLSYDRNNNLKISETIEGTNIFRSLFDYNARNQLVRVEDNLGKVNRIDVDIDGRTVGSTDKLGRTTTNRFSILGENLETVRPNGVTVTRHYGMDRQTTRISDARSGASTFEFDGLGRLTNAELPGGAKSTSGDYNDFFQPGTNSLPRGIEIHSIYDSEGKLTNRLYSGFGPDRTQRWTFDGLRRYKRIEDDQGSIEFTYDLAGWIRKLGFAYRFGAFPVPAANLDFFIQYDTYLNEFRKELTYPANSLLLTYDRDNTGRLVALVPSTGAPVIKSTSWLGETRIENRVLGQDTIRVENSFDGMRRVVGRRYLRISDGAVLADVRHLLDANGGILARQEVHRGGRADLFTYDEASRLIRWDADARPNANDGLSRSLEGFQPVLGLPGTWAAGGFAKEFSYDATDRFTSNRIINPDALGGIAPTITNLNGVDAMLFVTNLNGFARARDAVGNVTRDLLAVRIPGSALPSLVPATIAYDHLGRLTRVTRDDGVVVSHEYDSFNLRIRRTVTGSVGLCVPSDVAFLYDGSNLIEERDLADGARLIRRYYYGDAGDELIAADLDVAGALQRHWYLTDNVRSVVALADATGTTVERIRYDAWGQPRIEVADVQAPKVSSVRLETDGLSIMFTEPILALPSIPANGNDLVTTTAGLTGLVEVTVGGSAIPGQVKFDETSTASGFGSTVRFVTTSSISGPVRVRVIAGVVRDEWGNTNAAYSTNLTIFGGAGSVIATNAAAFSTTAVVLGRSSVGSPFLFHGQYFDEETGLVYLRARFYDPFTATFLQRDPAGYEDSVNHYAGFANNPVNLRDPSGAATDELGKQLVEIGSQASIKEDGISGFLVGRAINAVGNLLQLGTKAAEGLELCDSKAQGTFGLIDAQKGAALIIEDVQAAKAGFDKLNKYAAYGAAAASRVHGLIVGIRDRAGAGNALMRTKLRSEGLADFEIDGFINAQKRFMKEMKAKSVEVGIRGFGEKADARRERVESGMSQKGSSNKSKTDATAQVDQVIRGNSKGVVGVKTFTSDSDLYYVKADGRTVSAKEAARFQVIVGQEQAKAFRRAGKSGIPNVGVLHGPHVNMPESIGLGLARDVHGGRRGASADLELARKVGGPGAEAFSIRIGADGSVSAYNPSQDRLRGVVQQSLYKFRNTPAGQHSGPQDLGGEWFRGFDTPSE